MFFFCVFFLFGGGGGGAFEGFRVVVMASHPAEGEVKTKNSWENRVTVPRGEEVGTRAGNEGVDRGRGTGQPAPGLLS